MLYLIATPIGNLKDITLNALETLQKVDLILCEDTRTSFKLLKHHQISTPLESFHKFSEAAKEKRICEKLKQGLDIALISDAGTPTISDPGNRLVALCLENDIPLTSLPGPCSLINALVLSGLPSTSFQFLGFLPKKEKEKTKLLIDALFYEGVSIFFESPHRIEATLLVFDQIAPNHPLTIVREMTKRFENRHHGLAKELLKESFRGELVLLIEGNRKLPSNLNFVEMTNELIDSFSLSKKEALELCAKLCNLPKKWIYQSLLNKDNET